MVYAVGEPTVIPEICTPAFAARVSSPLMNAELSVVALPGEDSLTLPTQGRRPSSLLVPGVHVRKGLPFSVELGARV